MAYLCVDNKCNVFIAGSRLVVLEKAHKTKNAVRVLRCTIRKLLNAIKCFCHFVCFRNKYIFWFVYNIVVFQLYAEMKIRKYHQKKKTCLFVGSVGGSYARKCKNAKSFPFIFRSLAKMFVVVAN